MSRLKTAPNFEAAKTSSFTSGDAGAVGRGRKESHQPYSVRIQESGRSSGLVGAARAVQDQPGDAQCRSQTDFYFFPFPGLLHGR